jgi:hypothetical protein
MVRYLDSLKSFRPLGVEIPKVVHESEVVFAQRSVSAAAKRWPECTCSRWSDVRILTGSDVSS